MNPVPLILRAILTLLSAFLLFIAWILWGFTRPGCGIDLCGGPYPVTDYLISGIFLIVFFIAIYLIWFKKLSMGEKSFSTGVLALFVSLVITLIIAIVVGMLLTRAMPGIGLGIYEILFIMSLPLTVILYILFRR